MMPHPERACSEALGNIDGKAILQSLFIDSKVKLVTREAGLVNF
jgi:phosphoribosylformylglycinamidine synthase